MSRSYQKYPAVSYCWCNNKWAKRYANKKFRRINKIRLQKELEPLFLLREVYDVWGWPSDGKAFFEQNLILNQSVISYLSYINSYINNDDSHLYCIEDIINKYDNPENVTINDIKDYVKREWIRRVSK